jgi:putative heme-binding domain-containing protein
MRSSHLTHLIFLTCLTLTTTTQAIEPWADDQLPVRDGVELWFDCSRQNVGRGVVQLPPLNPRDTVDHLIDGSGHGRHLQQPLQDARPEYQQVNGAFLSFDGTNDSLFGVKLNCLLTNTTVFIVAQPRSNAGDFRGFFSLSQAGQNDYTSGLNMDLGYSGTPRLSFINIEGGGMRGATQLLPNWATPFNEWHMFSLESKSGKSGTRLFIDGAVQGARDRDEIAIALNDFVIGGRHYSNRGGAPYIQGFFDGGIAEFLLYDRILKESERAAVEQYLTKKYAGLLHPQLEAKQLVPVAKPPAVQMFVPGFAVRPLPLTLKNINDLKYRSDGKLVALGYNGRIYLLSDTDGDGLEDHAEPFWDSNSLRAPIGMALTPPGYARGQGVFVAAKGKVSLIVDTNRDDRADEEIIVASGWKELSHGVDALGVALDQQSNVYFGLGTADYTNPYLIDRATGNSGYRPGSERGTILKVSPDFKSREIVCTGVRFSVALAFNRLGDLFCTDQEGATWMPNGNPFDELLHIEPGRHYGFPPRHPKHLPDVIDEPSVFDYAPQHQSTCGLNFNEPVNGGPVFGPAWWSGDAIVCGYSRGKIYRTKLVKTAVGYVAQNEQIASLPSLTVDACVSPKGDLVVSTHSGPPDWGSGPEGEGRLYKISYADTGAPQPVLVWSGSPTEIRIAFDRPLDPGKLRNLTKRIQITQGKYVFAGDRFEVVRPGYAAVDAQVAQPRFDIAVEAGSITADGRTLIINTQRRQEAVNCGIILSQWKDSTTGQGAISQIPDMDLVTDLSGIEAQWTAKGSPAPETQWIPHVDLSVARQLTEQSSSHAQFWSDVQKSGTLTLRGQLNLWEMLQPAIQPGAKLDYERKQEEVSVVFAANKPFQARLGSDKKQSSGADRKQEIIFTHSGEQDLIPFELTFATGDGDPELTASWFTDQDARRRAFPLRRFFMPWAGGKAEILASKERGEMPELAGGNWLRGKKMFFNEPLNCQRCHSIRGEGNHVGPDLSNLVFRDYASVLRDIQQPSATLNPDFLAYNIQSKDGEDISGVLQTETPEKITVIDGNAHTTSISKSHVASIKPSAISFMPEGLLQTVNPAHLKDLMTFLLTMPLEPAQVRISGEPPARKAAEVAAALKDSSKVATACKPGESLKIILCAGPKDHGESEHDYPLWQKRWMTLLSQDEHVHVETAWEWPKPEQFQAADAIVFYSGNHGWSVAREKELESFLARGKGVVFVHLALDGHEDPNSLAKVIGLAWQSGVSKFRHGPLHLAFSPNPVAGFQSIDFVDESYWNLIGDTKDVNVIASSEEDGEPRPQAWVREHGGGRVFVCIPGHYVWTFDDPVYRALLLRGICWAAGKSVDSLADLAAIGARIAN